MLNGLQQIIYLLALQREGRDYRDRLRLPAEIAEKYILQASPAVPGSYIQPALLGNASSDLFAPQDLLAVREEYGQLSIALSENNPGRVREIIGDPRARRRILRGFQEMIPSQESAWRLETGLGQARVQFDPHVVADLVGELEWKDRDDAASYVIGKLMRIDFDAKKLTLKYPPTKKVVDCFYDESVEELLLSNPRELIQVSGEVTMGDDGTPRRISNVEDIRKVDLAPATMVRVELEHSSLLIDPQLTIAIQLDESSQFFTAVDEDLGIDATAETREELLEIIEQDIDVQWRAYANAQDNELTRKALARKNALRDRITEVPHAAK
ncbi:MAG: hypothetical protein ABI876_11635 [Bacteroidota bacterium]